MQPKQPHALSPRALVAAACALLALLASASASAQQRTVRLVYVRGAGAQTCPSESALRAAVTARVGYDPFRPDARTIITATIERGDRGMRATIEARDAAGPRIGVRDLQSGSSDCGELTTALVLMISAAILPPEPVRRGCTLAVRPSASAAGVRGSCLFFPPAVARPRRGRLSGGQHV